MAITFTDEDFSDSKEESKPSLTFSESDFEESPRPQNRPVPKLTLGEKLSGPLYTAADIAERIGYGLAHPIKMLETTAETAASQIAGKPQQLLVRPSEVMETPIVAIPEIPKQPTIARQLLAGVGNTAINFANFLQTPEGIATMGIGGLPKAAQRQLTTAFATQMATDAPQQLQGALQEAQEGNWQGVAHHLSAAGAEAFMAKHLAKPEPVTKLGIRPDEVPLAELSRTEITPEYRGPVGIGVEGFPVQSAIPSGLSMSPSLGALIERGGIPATPQMLEMLPKPSIEELSINQLLREPMERGPALAHVEELGQRIRRAEDFERARAERVKQSQEDAKATLLHPDKPLTDNQLNIIQDSLRKAILDNQIPGERPGIISGTNLEKWADDMMGRDFRGRVSANPIDIIGKQIPAMAIKGAALMERGITKFVDWSEAMIKEYGQDIKPLLKNAYIHSLHLKGGDKPNARSIEQATEVHGNVQPFPIEGVREMSAQEGGGRIQSQAEPRLQEEVQAQGRALDDLTKKGEPNEKEAQKEEALRETVAQSGAGPSVPEFTLTPAVEAEGRVFTGMNHADAIVHAAKNGVDALDAEHKFLGSDGKFYNRKEAGAIFEQKTGNKPKFEEGLHSTELEQAGLLDHVKGPGEVNPTAKAPPEQLAPAIAESEKSKVQVNTPAAMAVGIAPPGTELAQRIIDWARTLPAKLAGKAAPLTSRASERSGNALVQFASAKTASPLQAKSMATDVLGEHFKDADFSKKLGAVLVEDRLRSIPNEQAGTIIGKEYSPFKTESEYQAALKDSEIQAAIERHKQTVQQEAQEAHEATGGELAGPGLQTGAFVNLKAVMPVAEEFFGGTSRGNLENPLKRKTRFGKEAKGTAEQYELDYRTLAERMIQGNFEEVAKRNLYKQLVDDGLAIVQKPGLPAPKIGGKPTTRFTIERRGGNVEYLWLRKDLAGEFRQAENVEGPVSQSALITAAQALNRIQLKGPTDAVWHVANMMASIAGSQGGKNVLTDLARKFPGVNVADAVGRITASAIKILADDPEIQRQLADIAKIGAGRETHPGGFLSRSINLIDKAGRLVRDNMYKNLVDRGLVEANEATRREWINQLGNYNGRLMSQFQRIFKEAGFSPFIVAGRNFNRMAARRITLDPGIKAANPAAYWEMKGIEAFGIMATLVAVPSLINLATTGKPSGRPGVKFGQIDTGKDDSQGKHIVIDPAQWTGIRRGLRISGAQAVIEGVRQGQPHAKIARNAITDVLGGIIHPWAGPAVSAPVIGVTGYSPTLHKESENPKDYGTNVKEALKQLNPVAEAAITAYEKKEGPAKYTSPITAIGKSLGGAAGIKQVTPFTAQSQMYNLAHRWMEKSGDPKLLKKFEHDLNTDYGESDYKPLRQALQANDTDKAKAELTKLKEFKSKSDIMKAMRNAVTRSFSGSKATESKFLRSLTEEQRQQYNKAKEERREEYRKFLAAWRQ